MITCPNCGKQVADDTVHCGHCGHRVQADQKKTMLGMAAISPADLQKALAQGRENAQKSAGGQEASNLKLPTSGDVASAVDERPSGFALPRPEVRSAPPAGGVFASGGQAAGGPSGADDEGTAKTEMLPQIDMRPESPAGLGASAVTEPEGDDASRTTGPLATGEAGPFAGEGGGVWGGPETGDGFASPTLAFEPGPPLAHGAPEAASPFAQGPGAWNEAPAPGEMTTAPPPGEMHAASPPGNHLMVPPASKNNKKLFIILGAAAAVLFGCCILGVILQFVL